MSRSGIVNVRMVITEEKILSNVDKVLKMINPKSKKQIVQLDEDGYFKDLVESIKTYLIEYPKKRNFPANVYKSIYGLVEFATNQFEENTKKIEELIRQREENIALAGRLKELVAAAKTKQKGWKDSVKEAEEELSEEIIEALTVVGKSRSVKTEAYQDSLKLLNARVNNLESNLHIEIDMERIEDKSKALSYVGIEIADALKVIPSPTEENQVAVVEEEIIAPVKPARRGRPAKAKVAKVEKEPVAKVSTPILQIEEVEEAPAPVQEELAAYTQAITFETKPSFWERIKNSKLVRAVRYVMKIRIRIELPNALPEGRGENY